LHGRQYQRSQKQQREHEPIERKLATILQVEHSDYPEQLVAISEAEGVLYEQHSG